MAKTLRFIYYIGILGLVFLIGHITYIHFPWLPPIIALIIFVFVLLFFGTKDKAGEWIHYYNQLLNEKFLNSRRNLIIINMFLFLIIIMFLWIDLRIISGKQLKIDKTIYEEAVDKFISSNVVVRVQKARSIHQIILRYKEPSQILPGFLMICEDPEPKVQLYCKGPIESHLFESEKLSLELETLILYRLGELRRIYCKPSLSYRSKDLFELSFRAYNLLLTFKAISKFIKSSTKIEEQKKICNGIIWETLDILALLISLKDKRRVLFTLDEWIVVLGKIDEIKVLLRFTPFEESYKFIIDPQKNFFEGMYSEPMVKSRIRQFVDKEKVNQIYKQVLADPIGNEKGIRIYTNF